MSKFFKIFHKQCVIEKKTYFLTIKYGFDLNPLEVVLKEKKSKKIVYKTIFIKSEPKTIIHFNKFEQLILSGKII